MWLIYIFLSMHLIKIVQLNVHFFVCFVNGNESRLTLEYCTSRRQSNTHIYLIISHYIIANKQNQHDFILQTECVINYVTF